MKHLKEKTTGHLVKTNDLDAKTKVLTGDFAYIKKAKFKRYFKEDQKQKARYKKPADTFFNSGKLKRAEAFLLAKCTTKKDENGDDLLDKQGKKQYKLKTS